MKNNVPNDLTLWYTQPAKDWETEALPIGNGYMGGMIFGGVQQEHIQFNEKTLWTGGPGEWDGYTGGNWKKQNLEPLQKIRNLINQQMYEEADEVAYELMHTEKAYGAYQTFGDIYLNFFNAPNKIDKYVRLLDIGESVARVIYIHK